ncbi:RNA polymerase sigma factor [Halofilum ochraceum]|uniref:RNA polymerase sigma factor n=1 Tax=Halofilum ochraceum TaxID=1611323 RepID=UPI001C30F9EF|nr:sigma-70 family RNA polymerase sigma factor [Halofilum ochraceum]
MVPARLGGHAATVYISGQIGPSVPTRYRWPPMIALRDSIVDEIPHLRRYALRLAHDADAAEDLVQDCIERALRREHQWDPATRLRPWLFRIEHNLYVSARRRRTPENRGARLPADLVAPASTPEAGLDLLAVHRALRRIPPEQAETLQLVTLHGLDYRTAADILGIPIGTVRSRISRGRAALRGLLGMDTTAA